MVSRRRLVAVALLAVLGLAACTVQGEGNGGGPSASATSAGSGQDGSFSVTVAAAGDVLSHAAVTRDAQKNAGGKGFDFRPMFADVTPLISAADLALCHMETPIAQTDTHLTVGGELVFNTPHEMLDGVKSAGYDGCDFASNHAWDQGLDGLKSTTAAFADAGLGYVGPNPDPPAPPGYVSPVDGALEVEQLDEDDLTGGPESGRTS